MRDFRKFKIEIFGLKNGEHQFEFGFDSEFFAAFENSLIDKGKGSCSVLLTKSDSMISLHFEVTGSIELECDRSLDHFDHPVQVEKDLLFKYGDEEKELSEDVFVITKGTQEINIANFLYESLHLEIPMKKLHPRFQNEENSDNDEIIFSSKTKENDNEVADPRWEALKKLKK